MFKKSIKNRLFGIVSIVSVVAVSVIVVTYFNLLTFLKNDTSKKLHQQAVDAGVVLEKCIHRDLDLVTKVGNQVSKLPDVNNAVTFIQESSLQTQ